MTLSAKHHVKQRHDQDDRGKWRVRGLFTPIEGLDENLLWEALKFIRKKRSDKSKKLSFVK